jgi:hypothetical protein
MMLADDFRIAAHPGRDDAVLLSLLDTRSGSSVCVAVAAALLAPLAGRIGALAAAMKLLEPAATRE